MRLTLTVSDELALMPAPIARRDLALLRSRNGLSWITLKSGESGDPIGTPRLVPAMGPPSDARGFVFGTGRIDLPGLFFRPALRPDGASDRQQPLGHAFIAGRREDESERHDLYVISCSATPAQSSFHRLGEGIPLGIIGPAGAHEIVCLTTRGLRRYNELGNTILDFPNPLLRGVQRAAVTERIVACWGVDGSTSQPRWFTALVDQHASGRLIEQLASNDSVPPPILLGRHLIAVERLPTGQGDSKALYLTRRLLAPPAADA